MAFESGGGGVQEIESFYRWPVTESSKLALKGFIDGRWFVESSRLIAAFALRQCPAGVLDGFYGY